MSKNTKQENIECKNLEKKSKYTSVKMKKGITLIALVVTIVVLLILASVSITVVFGDNGILELAKEAGDKTNEAVKNDISSIGELEDILHETQTGIKVDKVTDTKPGELEQDETETNTYTINSIEDLVVFAHDVTSGHETYADKTVKLGLSLDFASTKSYVDANRTDYGKYGYDGELKKLINESGFIPIGHMDYKDNVKQENFQGTFDGNKNKIYNLKIKQRIETGYDGYTGSSIGMFSINFGTIKNLEIQNVEVDIDIKPEFWNAIGILAGDNESVIENCGVIGSINGNVYGRKNIGGLVGVNGDMINNCYSKCNINITEQDNIRIGSLVGTNQVSDENIGKVTATIKNAYSAGNMYHTINGGIQYYWIGGILGYNTGIVENAYTIGKTEVMINEDVSSEVDVGNVYGYYMEDSKASNCYYLDNKIYVKGKTDKVVKNDYGTLKAEKEMKTEDFVNSLNNGQEGTPWKQDTKNINDGYPILSWQQ